MPTTPGFIVIDLVILPPELVEFFHSLHEGDDGECRFCALLWGNAPSEPSHVVLDIDDIPYDIRPDACWRCDAATATTDVGLCAPCKGALTEPEAEPTWRGQEPTLVILDEIADFDQTALDAVADHLG